MKRILLLTLTLSGLLLVCQENTKETKEKEPVKIEEVDNTAVKSSYPYEIYKKGSEYIGVILQDKFKTETLEKSGNKYSVKGNKYGEYYIITSAMEMTLFDKNGELASIGYKATKE